MTPATRRELLLQGLDDWIMFTQLVHLISGEVDDAADDGTLRSSVLVATSELLDDGLFVAGDVTRDSGFVAWELSSAAALERIERRWMERGQDLQPGDVCWFASTPAADDLAAALP